MSSERASKFEISRRTLLTTVGAGAAIVAAPWVRRGYAADTIPVGVVVGLTGRASPWGVSVANAVRLVVEEINKNGGIKSKGGAKIELIMADHQSQSNLAGTLTERVIELQKAVCVIGYATSAASIVGSKAADRLKTPVLSTDTADDLSEQGLKYYFRVGPKSGTLATGAVNFAIEAAKATGLAPKKVAILADDTTFSQSSVKGVLRDFPKTGWTLAENISYPGGGVSDFATIIQRLKLTGVDLLIQSTFPADGIQINRAMKAVDYNPIAALHVSGAPYTPDFISATKADGDYITCSVGYVPELVQSNPYLQEFAKNYEATHKRTLDDQASQGCLAAGVLYDALERAKGITREDLTEALRATDVAIGANKYVNRDGVKFGATGDNEKAKVVVMQLRGGEQRIVYPADLASQKPVWPMPAWNKRG
jgi:branched-chain amino acid transport system substrate-binding protein